jgi:signal transduction histidine kinase/PAS domain-containing protein
MFIKLNRKILYSLLVFLGIVAGIFLTIFINFYTQKLNDNKNSIYIRNQYVVELLNDNLKLRRELIGLLDENPQLTDSPYLTSINIGIKQGEQELTREQKLNAELQKNYDDNHEALVTGSKIVGAGLIVVVLFIILLLYLLDKWVLMPVEKMIDVSRKVALGIFSCRLPINEKSRFRDEFDILFSAFNKMLENTEYNIEVIKERERFFQQLVDAFPDAVRVIDKDYNVIMVNSAYYRQFKIKNSCIGEKCYKAYGYSCETCAQSRYDCPLRYLLRRSSGYMHSIHEVNKIPLHVSAARLDTVNGKVCIIETLHDLSGDIRFSHQQKVASLGFLSTSIAHEMKNNIGSIRLIIDGLLDSEYADVPDTDRRKKYLLLVQKQLSETIKTPERLLSLARYSENEKTTINVDNAVKDMVQLIDYEAKKHGISIRTEIDRSLSVIGNEADFKMIILNLAQNAIKAMANGGELYILGMKSNKRIVINVSDTGSGIEKEKLEHIFEPFYSGTHYSKGSGLGLAIVSNLVDKIKGKIEVSSTIGKGTVFTITIPLPRERKQKS